MPDGRFAKRPYIGPVRETLVRARTALFFGATSEMFCEKTFGGGVELEAVFGAGEAVAFVLEEQVFVVDAFLFHGGDELLRFGLLYARVVGALGDEHGNSDAVNEEEGRARLEELLLRFGVADPFVECGE